MQEFHESRRQRKGEQPRWKRRIWHRREDMLKKMPESGFPVAVDNAGKGKKFTYFDSHEEFFRETAVHEQKNFYEMIKPESWCRAYFDIEHYTDSAEEAGGIKEIIETIRETMKVEWKKELDGKPAVLEEVVVLEASRIDIKAEKYKH